MARSLGADLLLGADSLDGGDTAEAVGRNLKRKSPGTVSPRPRLSCALNPARIIQQKAALKVRQKKGCPEEEESTLELHRRSYVSRPGYPGH